ncbi:hypothetical protein ACFL0W_06015 [Nanoarchaeota archaeon]
MKESRVAILMDRLEWIEKLHRGLLILNLKPVVKNLGCIKEKEHLAVLKPRNDINKWGESIKKQWQSGINSGYYANRLEILNKRLIDMEKRHPWKTVRLKELDEVKPNDFVVVVKKMSAKEIKKRKDSFKKINKSKWPKTIQLLHQRLSFIELKHTWKPDVKLKKFKDLKNNDLVVIKHKLLHHHKHHGI